MNTVAVDLGSNTFRVVQMECTSLEPVAWYEKIVRTADGLHESGKISEAAVERILEAAKEAKGVIDLSLPTFAVTTEALRKASNAEEVLERIKKESGLNFRIISGAEEADFTLLAVKKRLEKLGVESESFVMADIGGGSTEILFYEAGRVCSGSFGVGIVTVAQKYGSLEKIEEALPAVMGDIYEFVRKTRAEGYSPRTFVSTAGTPTTVAAMKLGMTYESYSAKEVNGTILKREDLKRQFERLLALDEESRRKLVGVGREDLIAAGILILERLFEAVGFEETTVIDDGLREGLAIAGCLGMLKNWEDSFTVIQNQR
ncbi:exopolyphosphatase [Hydrogenimonas sp.]|nr:exopolyphosphatase [Hydrogenimonas sp.]